MNDLDDNMQTLKLNAIIKLDKKATGDVVKTWTELSHSKKILILNLKIVLMRELRSL